MPWAALLALAFVAPPAHVVVLVDGVAARTAIGLWHELHVARAEPHDFSGALAPEAAGAFYVAACRGGRMRAVAVCDHEDDARTRVRVGVVAHHPEDAAAAASLVRQLRARAPAGPAWPLRDQPRLFLEDLASRADAGE